jgi:hypothetical protein
MSPQAIAHYRIIAKLGEGGRGEVPLCIIIGLYLLAAHSPARSGTSRL